MALSNHSTAENYAAEGSRHTTNPTATEGDDLIESGRVQNAHVYREDGKIQYRISPVSDY
jgi:hypothetical protein